MHVKCHCYESEYSPTLQSFPAKYVGEKITKFLQLIDMDVLCTTNFESSKLELSRGRYGQNSNTVQIWTGWNRLNVLLNSDPFP